MMECLQLQQLLLQVCRRKEVYVSGKRVKPGLMRAPCLACGGRQAGRQAGRSGAGETDSHSRDSRRFEQRASSQLQQQQLLCESVELGSSD